jgi:N-methylhydantoinase A
LSSFDPAYANNVLRGLTEESVAIARAGGGDAGLVIERKAFMRYRGQGWEIAVPLPNDTLGTDGGEKLRVLFEAQYAQLFGNTLAELDIEVMNWSVRAVSETQKAAHVSRVSASHEVTAQDHRRIYDPRIGKDDAVGK